MSNANLNVPEEGLSSDYDLKSCQLEFERETIEQTNGGVPAGAIGWRSLLDYLEQHVGEPEFLQVSLTDMNSDPERAIYGFKQNGATPHWLLVSFVTSELFDKQLDDPNVSGWGYELTLRYAGDGQKPPQAAIDLMNAVVEYQVNCLARLDLFNTIDLTNDEEDQVTSLTQEQNFVAIRKDPRLSTALTPLGSVEFRQILSITQAEQEMMLEWNCEKVIQLLGDSGGDLLISGTQRPCLTSDPETVARIEQQIAAQGSSGECLFVQDHLQWNPKSIFRQPKITFTREIVDSLCRRLMGRIPFNRSLLLYAEECTLTIEPAKECQLCTDKTEPVLRITTDACQRLTELLKSDRTEFTMPEFAGLCFRLGDE